MSGTTANSNRDILCVIPARAGSKGIPGKNTIEFSGKPLLAWTIEAALGAESVGPVIVTTESEETAGIAKEWGADVPFLRPAELAQDNVHAIYTVLHTLNWYQESKGHLPFGVMMLLPTSPLRTVRHVEEAAQLFLTQDAPAVIGVTDLGKHMTNLRYMNGHLLERVASDVSPNQQRQGVASLYGVTGAMFLARSDLLKAEETFHLSGALGFPMSALSAIDVNTPEDLALARWVKKAGWSDKALRPSD
ncbi:acylneuraminate cytidylyltransferase family protein [Ruegeria arenilitoris]|uniref:acylneuraminate cytidylyltransferase family protein n=1 Tax=Ruegeria arenilitoris TaxID=1173585 RepID=UPI00147E33E8